VLAALDDVNPGEGYTAAELAPLVGLTPRNTATKLAGLDDLCWLISSKAKDPKTDRQTYYRISV